MTERSLPAPVVLALDAAGLACSVAVAAGERVLCAERQAIAHGQAEALVPMVAAAMCRAGLAASAISLVAATVGPGGFTGIRVGLAAARGIALATGARLIGVTSFEAVAAALPDGRDGEPGGDLGNHLLIALESRRDDLYVQLFDPARRPLAPPVSVMPEALAELLGRLPLDTALLIAGDAAARAAEALPRYRDVHAREDAVPDAVGVVRAAMRRWRQGETEGPVAPLYLRSPDVSVPSVRRAAPRRAS